jgi:hypothetical protein
MIIVVTNDDRKTSTYYEDSIIQCKPRDDDEAKGQIHFSDQSIVVVGHSDTAHLFSETGCRIPII